MLFLGNTKLEDDAEDVVEALISRVQKMFESYCDRTFDAATYTEYHDGNYQSKIITDQWPITTVSGIWEDSSWEWGSGSELDSTSYRTVHSRYIVLNAGYFTKAPQSIKIIYTAGYSTIPEDLKHACVMEVVRLFRNFYKAEDIGTFGRTEGDVTTTYQTEDLLPAVKTILAKYRRVMAL